MTKIKEIVEMQLLKKQRIKVQIKGTTPLLMERMDTKVAETYDKKKSKQHVDKDIRSELEKLPDKIHKTSDGKVGFPAIAFHKAMIEVAPYIDGLNKKLVTGSIRVDGGVLPIKYNKQLVNESIGKTSGISKSPRLIIRPEFTDWSCELTITYNSSNISAENIYNLLNWAGFHMGIGGWRPSCGGSYGQFEVNTGGKK